MNKEKNVDFSPSKRIFLSIIADYNLKLAICELIDNTLDINFTRKNALLKIEIDINIAQQVITVKDNAGGIEEKNIKVILGPGHTTNDDHDEIIGMFGVGTKRAMVAMAENIRINTRFNSEAGIVLKFDNDWLKSDDWHLPYHYDNSISPNTTNIELTKLRNLKALTDEDIERLRTELGMTYNRFINNQKIVIILNNKLVNPINFEKWSYPPKYKPTKYNTKIEIEKDVVEVEIFAGLANISSNTGEFGVYFYCNDRLICREIKDYNVGIEKSHPTMSLARIIVSLKGPAKRMPWNSSKSAIRYEHEVFQLLRPNIQKIVETYTALSKRLDWQKEVFEYSKGSFVEEEIEDLYKVDKSIFPDIPKSRPRYYEMVEAVNRNIISKKPWLRGIPESVVIADEVSKKRYNNKNRAALILLDSTLEISFKEYLANEQKNHHYTDSELLDLSKSRNKLDNEIKKYRNLSDVKYVEMWDKIRYYHNLKNKLFHERIPTEIEDDSLEEFKSIVQIVLKILFGLNLDQEELSKIY